MTKTYSAGYRNVGRGGTRAIPFVVTDGGQHRYGERVWPLICLEPQPNHPLLSLILSAPYLTLSHHYINAAAALIYI